MKRFLPPRLLLTPKPNIKPIRPLTAYFPALKGIQTKHLSTTTYKMSFSNADTGSKPADPYKAENLDQTSIKEKIEDLADFISSCKFGMMTTRAGSSGALVSRCMALAGKVFSSPLIASSC
jgi:hypothetical protein